MLCLQRNNRTCQQAAASPSRLLRFPLGASELQVALRARIPITVGLSPPSSTQARALLSGFPSLKCKLSAAAQLMPGVNETHPGPLSGNSKAWLMDVCQGLCAEGRQAWGTTHHPSSPFSRKEATGSRAGKASRLLPLCHLAFPATGVRLGPKWIREQILPSPTPHCPLKRKSAPWNLAVVDSSNTRLHQEFCPRGTATQQ